jgi:hypothetical protein
MAFIKAMRVLLLSLIGGWGLQPAALSAQVPPDEAWRTLTTEHFRVTFPAGMESLGRRAADRAERAWTELSRAFVDPPGGRIDLLLTDHADISNGFAQIRPSNRMTIYARPPADDLGLGYFDDWMELVVTHELAHVFHLDRAGPLGRALRSVFGRAPASWPFFPGAGVPRWTSEGLATWYESYFSDAGRVHGTYHEMVVRTAAVEGRFERLDQVAGNSPEWPGGLRAYAYGSLFFDHLLEKYGPDRMGLFAEAVAGQWVPYRLDAAGRKALGATLSEEWLLWKSEVERGAGETRARAEAVAPVSVPEMLTRDARVALYPRVSPGGGSLAYGSSDGRSDSQIRVTDPDGGADREGLRTNAVATFDWMDERRLLVSQLEFDSPYTTFGDLFEMDLSGGVRRLTRGARLSQPSVAPGGAWAVAVQDGGGTNGLVRVDLATGTVSDLVAPDADVHWSYPAVSPDGRWVAASRWSPGAFMDVVVLDADGAQRLQVTRDRAVDLAPAWSPDGSMLAWGSDRTGVPNILAAAVDPAAGTAGPVLLATNLVTGGAYPSVDPTGSWLYFSGYHADGWEVERVAWTPSRWAVAPPPVSRFAAPPRAAAVQEAEAEGTVEGYSPFPTLLPTYWEPLYKEPIRTARMSGGGHTIPARQVMDASVGLRTSGSDLVGRHAWNAFGRVFTSGDRMDAGASYSFWGLGSPGLSVGASQFWDDDGPRLGQRAEDAPLDTLYVLERSRNLTASLTLPRTRWRSNLTLVLSGGLSWERRELLDAALRPSASYTLTRPESRFTDLRATLSYTTARSHAFQTGSARGVAAFVRGRARAQLSLPDSLLGRPGRDGSVDDVLAQVRLFHALGGPGFASHVLALRASGGVARGPGADAGYFEAGGAAGTSESLTGLTLFGGAPLFFPVRGYDESVRYGKVAWSGSAEYRFPLWSVNRGLGAWPIHVDRVTGALFADAGNAWGPELGIQGFQNPRRATLASLGAEVTTEVLALWASSLRIRAGLGVPLVEGDGARVYLRLGLSF